MNTTSPGVLPTPGLYPERDGNPLSDNTKQLRWIVMLYDNLTSLTHERPDILVAGDLLWYPREGEPEVRCAPDVMVIFGRPKGDRGSYKQWEEGGVPVTVAFEILSPSNDVHEMADKLAFYDEYGVEEYYLYDPDKNHLTVYLRKVAALRRVRPVEGFVSPRLGIRFDLSGPEMVVYGPDKQRFLTFEELRQQEKFARQKQVRMAELSRKARRQQASPEELQELERLEDEASS